MGIQERKEREKEHRREEIVEAAQRVFFEKGLQAATMDEIAEAAELSKGTIYLYYKSKEDLYLAVMLRGLQILYNMLSAAISTEEPTMKKIATLLELYYRFFIESKNYFRMLNFFENQQFHKQVSEQMLQHCAQQEQKLWDLAIGLIERGISEGVIRKNLKPMEIVTILWSSANAIMLRIDYQHDVWKSKWNIDWEDVLRTSNALLLEAIMTEEAKQQYKSLLLPKH